MCYPVPQRRRSNGRAKDGSFYCTVSEREADDPRAVGSALAGYRQGGQPLGERCFPQIKILPTHVPASTIITTEPQKSHCASTPLAWRLFLLASPTSHETFSLSYRLLKNARFINAMNPMGPQCRMDCPCNQSIEILTEKWEYDTLRQNSSILLEQPKDGVLPKERTNELESME